MNDLETQISEFIINRYKKGESTAPRHIHIRFGTEIDNIEKILEKLLNKDQISKYYDGQYQEDRYTSKKPVKE